MINIDVLEQYSSKINPEILINTANAVIQNIYNGEEVDLSLVITSDSVINDLNLRFRDMNSPTDVLSFPSEYIDPENSHKYIGDIIISYPRAVDQAVIASHPIENEITLLIVHGVLHLFGYDHGTPDEKEKMWEIQSRILVHLGCKINNLTG